MPKNISATIPQRVSLLYPLNKVVVILTKKQEENYNEFWNRSSFSSLRGSFIEFLEKNNSITLFFKKP
jgi:hypothetical protein